MGREGSCGGGVVFVGGRKAFGMQGKEGGAAHLVWWQRASFYHGASMLSIKVLVEVWVYFSNSGLAEKKCWKNVCTVLDGLPQSYAANRESCFSKVIRISAYLGNSTSGPLLDNQLVFDT